MSKQNPSNLAASVRQRLLNQARERHEDFQLVLIHFGVERLLYRLSRSPHAGQFVLKGAMLFSAWQEMPHRPTRDLDLLGYGDADVESVVEVLIDVTRADVEPDGLDFDEQSIRGEEIREAQEYRGVRIRLQALLAGATIPLQIDVAFGDVVTPAPETVEYPSLLNMPSPRLRAYPPESVVAEKFQALVALGMANTRLKDFYDLWVLANRMGFDGQTLQRTMAETFRQRCTPIPSDAPIALTAEFHDDTSKQAQWRAFLLRTGLQAPELPKVADQLREFLLPPTAPIVQGQTFTQHWPQAGPWHPAQNA